MNFKEFYNLIRERYDGTTDDENYKKQVVGAFRLVFDLDEDQIITKETKENRSLSNELGISRLSVGDWWFAPENAHCAMKDMFFIIYKNIRYIIHMDVICWDKEPTPEDFENSNKGKGKTTVKRVPFNFNNPMTATGDVQSDNWMVDWTSEKDKMERDIEHLSPSIHDYPNHFRFNNMVELATKVKRIIDGDRGKRTNTKPFQSPPKIKQPNPTKPVLV
jgi:hypothetical protein